MINEFVKPGHFYIINFKNDLKTGSYQHYFLRFTIYLKLSLLNKLK